MSVLLTASAFSDDFSYCFSAVCTLCTMSIINK